MAPDQNLINQTKIIQDRPAGYWKSIILDLVSILSAAGLGYAYFRYLVTGAPVWCVIAVAFVFGAASVLQVFLSRGTMRRMLALICESAFLVIWFIYTNDPRITLLAGILAFLFLLWGYASARAKARNEIEISFLGTSRRVLTKLTTAVLLAMILLYAPQADNRGDFVSREHFTPLFNWAAGFLNNFYPSLSLRDSYGTFAEGLAKVELQNNPAYGKLPPGEQAAAVKQAVAQISEEIKAVTGILPSSSSPLSDVAYSYIVTTIASWKDKFQGQFVIAWVLVVFFTLRFIAAIFVWAAQFVSLIIYEIMIATGFMRIAETTQTKEELVY